MELVLAKQILSTRAKFTVAPDDREVELGSLTVSDVAEIRSLRGRNDNTLVAEKYVRALDALKASDSCKRIRYPACS